MDPLTIIAYAVQALYLVPKVSAAGQDIVGYIAKTTGIINAAHASQTPIPDAAWAELRATREALQAELHAP